MKEVLKRMSFLQRKTTRISVNKEINIHHYTMKIFITTRSNLIFRESFYIRPLHSVRNHITEKSSFRRRNSVGIAKRVKGEKYPESIRRSDISNLRVHKALLEGDAQMTNRSANNKSVERRRYHGVRFVESRDRGRGRGSRLRKIRHRSVAGIEFALPHFSSTKSRDQKRSGRRNIPTIHHVEFSVGLMEI